MRSFVKLFTLNGMLFLGLGMSVLVHAEDFSDYDSFFVGAFVEPVLLHVTSNAMPGFFDLRLKLDSDGDLVELQTLNDQGKQMQYTLKQLQEGILLYESDGHKVIQLSGQHLIAHSGGTLDMNYLTNGLFNSRDHFEMELVRVGSSWHLQTNNQSGHTPFTTMYLEANKWFGKVVGISKVIVH